MAKNSIKVETHFRPVKEAMYETVQYARQLALSEGKAVANNKLASGTTRRGYEDLGSSLRVENENIGFQSGRIFVETQSEKWGDDPFWARYFEYGTVHLPAMPFIRPGARAMNKTFLGVMGKDFEGFIRRKPFRKKL